MDAVGKKVAKDFGKQGVFLGEVQSVEYDTDDAAQEHPFFVVEYTDGDKEDFNETELEYGCELAFQIALDEEDDAEDASEASDVDTSDGPPKVCFSFLGIHSSLTLSLFFHSETTTNKEIHFRFQKAYNFKAKSNDRL